jgi:hypothetical protein
MGRPLVPTQSLPAFNSPHFSAHNLQNQFMTERETYRRAEAVIDKEQWRGHEIQPYAAGGPGSTMDALDLAPSTRGELDRRLLFDPSGDIVCERGTKRNGNGEEDDNVDIDAILPGAQPRAPVRAVPTAADDFPPVFKNPNLTQPELFSPANSMPPPPVPNRATRALPRRGFSKTVSAPVGRLGTWSGMDIDPTTGFAGFNGGAGAAVGATTGAVAAPFTSGFGGFSPSVSFAEAAQEDDEDGFDVSEWASSEQF